MVVHLKEVMINITQHFILDQSMAVYPKNRKKKKIIIFCARIKKKLCLEKRADVTYFHILITGY